MHAKIAIKTLADKKVWGDLRVGFQYYFRLSSVIRVRSRLSRATKAIIVLFQFSPLITLSLFPLASRRF